jgi:hypothetical protein
VPVALSMAHPACCVMLPAGAEDAQLALELHSAYGTVALDRRPATDEVISLAAVPGFGPQQLRATCRFVDGCALYAIDVLAEDAPDDRPPQVLTFTPSRPERTISWFASSPFRSGLRYRPHPAPGAAPAPWSAPHPRSVPLELVAG